MRALEFLTGVDLPFSSRYAFNGHAEYFLEKLKYSKYGNDEDLKTMMDNFEKSTKPTFKDPGDRSFIKFGSMRDRDPSVGIRSGQLPLEG